MWGACVYVFVWETKKIKVVYILGKKRKQEVEEEMEKVSTSDQNTL